MFIGTYLSVQKREKYTYVVRIFIYNIDIDNWQRCTRTSKIIIPPLEKAKADVNFHEQKNIQEPSYQLYQTPIHQRT